jgi:hypothetical protein
MSKRFGLSLAVESDTTEQIVETNATDENKNEQIVEGQEDTGVESDTKFKADTEKVEAKVGYIDGMATAVEEYMEAIDGLSDIQGSMDDSLGVTPPAEGGELQQEQPQRMSDVELSDVAPATGVEQPGEAPMGDVGEVGISPQTAKVIEVAVEQLNKRMFKLHSKMGVVNKRVHAKLPALESFAGKNRVKVTRIAKESLAENIKSGLKTALQGVINFFKKVAEFVEGMFGKLAPIKAKLAELKQKVSSYVPSAQTVENEKIAKMLAIGNKVNFAEILKNKETYIALPKAAGQLSEIDFGLFLSPNKYMEFIKRQDNISKSQKVLVTDVSKFGIEPDETVNVYRSKTVMIGNQVILTITPKITSDTNSTSALVRAPKLKTMVKKIFDGPIDSKITVPNQATMSQLIDMCENIVNSLEADKGNYNKLKGSINSVISKAVQQVNSASDEKEAKFVVDGVTSACNAILQEVSFSKAISYTLTNALSQFISTVVMAKETAQATPAAA